MGLHPRPDRATVLVLCSVDCRTMGHLRNVFSLHVGLVAWRADVLVQGDDVTERLTKRELSILGKIFAAEVENRLPCQLRDSKALFDLEENGYVYWHTERLSRGRLPIQLTGWQLTHAGRLAFCMSCDGAKE